MFDQDAQITKLIQEIHSHKGKAIYLVGGAVRDLAMGLTPKDYDYVVTGCTPEFLTSLGLKQVGKGFPVFLTEEGTEVALARTENKSGTGYYGFACDFNPKVKIEEDLFRRDFTINSMALDPLTLRLIDPFNGQRDIEDYVIRATNPDAFKEDPLRVLRAARFASRFGFGIHSQTADSMGVIPVEEFEVLPIERVTLEIEKAYRQSDTPSEFFKWFKTVGLLGTILPEIQKLVDIRENQEHHLERYTFDHTMMVIDQAKTRGLDVSQFWACLLHDFGKTVSSSVGEDGIIHHYQHEKAGVPLVSDFCEKYKLDAKTTRLATLFAEYHMRLHRWQESRLGTRVDMLEKFKVLHDEGTLARRLFDCSIADALGRFGLKAETKIQTLCYRSLFEKNIQQFLSVRPGDYIQSSDSSEVKQRKIKDARCRVLTKR